MPWIPCSVHAPYPQPSCSVCRFEPDALAPVFAPPDLRRLSSLPPLPMLPPLSAPPLLSESLSALLPWPSGFPVFHLAPLSGTATVSSGGDKASATSASHSTSKKPPVVAMAGGIYTCPICNEQNLHEVECGAGGDCLFYSCSYLMRQLPVGAPHQAGVLHLPMRAAVEAWIRAAAQPLAVWNHPAHPLIIKPTIAEANYIQPRGAWGGDLETLAIATHYGVIIHVIDIVYGQVFTYGTVGPTLHILFPGGHYRALAPAALAPTVPGPMRYWEQRAAARARATARKKEQPVSSSGRAQRKRKEEPELPFWNLALGADMASESASKSESSSKSASSPSSSSGEGAVARLEIHHINVGQGDATLIYLRDSGNVVMRSILIDTGRTGDELIAYLTVLNAAGDFRPIDVLCVSHYDSDHIGGARRLLTGKPPPVRKIGERELGPKSWVQHDLQVFDLGEPMSPDRDYTTYAEELENAPAESTRINYPLHTPLLELGGVTLRCMMFNGWSVGSRGRIYSSFADNNLEHEELADDNFHHGMQKNACSAALLLQFNQFSYFTAGDLLGRNETHAATLVRQHLAAQVVDHVCAMKHGHHGAHEASQPSVLDALRPRLGMISCGPSSAFGHPAPELIPRLEQYAQDLLGAQPNGTVGFHYRVSADTALPHSPVRPHGVVGASGASNVGHSVLTVTAAHSAAHQFHVADQAGAGVLSCGAGRRALALPVRADGVVFDEEAADSSSPADADGKPTKRLKTDASAPAKKPAPKKKGAPKSRSAAIARMAAAMKAQSAEIEAALRRSGRAGLLSGASAEFTRGRIDAHALILIRRFSLQQEKASTEVKASEYAKIADTIAAEVARRG